MNTAVSIFNGMPIAIIDHANQRWLTAEEVGLCLGYNVANARQGIINLYNRHLDRFDASDSVEIKLISTDSKEYRKRVFSLAGCITLGWLSNATRAKDFQHWAKQVLVQELAGQPPAPEKAPRHRGRAQITRQVEFDALTLFIRGLSQREIANKLAISKTQVNLMLHAKHRFPLDAGHDLTTPELIEAVVARHMSEERARLVRKYCANASNQRLTASLDEAGTRMVMGSVPKTTWNGKAQAVAA